MFVFKCVALNFEYLLGTTLKQKKYFLVRNLIKYTHVAMPVVVSGDFNIDVTKEENRDFIWFMKQFLYLDCASDPTIATTLGGTCLDLTFTRNVSVECRRYCTYFSYHRPILSILAVSRGKTNDLELNIVLFISYVILF